jgi:hypothetical protein
MKTTSGADRCCRCHATLTTEDKHNYGANCEPCELDNMYEEAEKHSPIKSAYWRWRAMCFGVRWLYSAPFAAGNVCMRSVRSRMDARRRKYPEAWK